MSVEQTQDRLIETFESAFACDIGPPKSFFEIPQRFGKPVRVIYSSYVASGNDLAELELWFIVNVVAPLAEKGVSLYWRLPSRIEVYPRQTHGKSEDYVIRTRIGVLDKLLQLVVIEDTVTPEGALMTRVGE